MKYVFNGGELIEWTRPYNPLMKCGHVAHGFTYVDGKKAYACPMCYGLGKNLGVIWDHNQPDKPDNRTARCICGKETESSWDLPYFKYQPHVKNDSYYCGCKGWD
mgnify:CR=1 FL=1